VLVTYPSYLGTLVQAGFDSGYRSTDFGVERVVLMGEMASEGLRRRAQELFGPLSYAHDYGMTELSPFGGAQCSQGHLHFEPSAGLLEVIGLDTRAPTDPSQPGTIVATPFGPYRETTLLIRYDTEDVVQALPEGLTCDLRGLPATSHLLGKRQFTVRHEAGWCFPRDVVEALESIDAVPLPARYGVKATTCGVEVEAVATGDHHSTRRRLVDELEERGIPVKGLRLVGDSRQLDEPRPVRADLHEGALSNGNR
jgi:phenylacetate-CoA ligase